MLSPFQSFISDLGKFQGQPVALSGESSFAYLFEGDLPVENNLSDDGRYLVTDIWVSQTNDLPTEQRELLLALLLEINGYAGPMHGAVFSLDEERRIVLSRSQPLAQLTVAHYLAALHDLLEQARQTRLILLTIYPVITIPDDADTLAPDQI